MSATRAPSMQSIALPNSLEALEPRIAPATVYVVDDSNHLISFDSATPGTVVTKNILGLVNAGTEIIKGIDFRPSNGQLYAIGLTNVANAVDEGRLYTIDVTTGIATAVNTNPFYSAFLDNDDFGFDINPAVDAARVVTDRDDNLRVNLNTGALVGSDTTLAPNTSAIVGTAYDRNFEGPLATTLFGIDLATDALVRIGGVDGVPSPNGGVVTSIGALGVDLGSNFKVGFDIESRTGIGYAAIRPSGGVTGLYTIDLTTGAATLIAPIGGNPSLNGLSVAMPNDLTIVNATTASYLDQDGDRVTVKITGAAPGASLNPGDFTFSAGQFGSQLKLLNLSDDGQEWAKASITITAAPVAGHGDSFVKIGYINATGVDLGKVNIHGDLGQIDAGDATTATPGLAGLTVQSLGAYSNSQLPTGGVPNQISNIVGKLGSLTVQSDMNRALIDVTGGADGSVGPVVIRGDLNGLGLFASAGIKATGAIGNVTLLGSLFGGSTSGTGSIIAGGSLGNVIVGGSIYGGSATNTGIIESGLGMGTVLVKGNIFGGTDDHTGNVHSNSNMGAVTILGSIIGGTVADPVLDIDSGLVYAFGNPGASIASVKVMGNLVGGNGDYGGTVYAVGTIKTVQVNGSLLGSSGNHGGTVMAGGNITTATINGDLSGGTGIYSGSLYTFSLGSINAVTVKGSVIGGNTLDGIIASGQLGTVKIFGEVRADSAGGVRISAAGNANATTAAQASAIKTLSINGNVKNALIFGGYSGSGIEDNADATVGAVTVGGDWIASSLIVGVKAGTDGLFGTDDDAKIDEAQVDSLFSKIASVTIKGQALGTVGGTDRFGILAEQIGAVKVGNRTYTLGAGTDTAGLQLGSTLDFRVREV